MIKVEHFNNCLPFINFYFFKLKEQNGQQKLWQGKFIADIKCKHCVSEYTCLFYMFVATFPCADIMNVSWVKINLKLTLSLRFFLYVVGIEEYKLDTLCITDCKMYYEMIALYAGKVSNYFTHSANLVHFLMQLK